MHRAWINTEGLPEYRTDEYQALVDRWVEATGAMPDVGGVANVCFQPIADTTAKCRLLTQLFLSASV